MYMQQGRLVIISFTLATACIFMTQQCFFAESFSKPSLIPKKFFKTVEGTHTVLRKKIVQNGAFDVLVFVYSTKVSH